MEMVLQLISKKLPIKIRPFMFSFLRPSLLNSEQTKAGMLHLHNNKDWDKNIHVTA